MLNKSLVTLTTVALLLSACGGGGGGSNDPSPGGSTPTPTTPTPTTPTPTSPDLQTTVPDATYPADSPEMAFRNAFNAFRGAQGLGLLAQSTQLDTAAKNHLNYVTTYSNLNGGDVDMASIEPTYNRPRFHIEDSGKAGFTGVQELDRANFAGYGGTYVGELGAYGSGKGSVAALQNLIDTVYHRAGLLFQNVRDMGIAVAADRAQTMVILVGQKSTPQRNASDYVGFYPADTQTGVPLFTAIESPNPFPDLPYSEYATKTGYPIHIMGEQFTTITVNSFTVTEDGQSAPMDSRLLTQANDPHNTLAKNVAFLVAKQSFKPNTKYNVAFNGVIGGYNVTRAWSFTTGS